MASDVAAKRWPTSTSAKLVRLSGRTNWTCWGNRGCVSYNSTPLHSRASMLKNSLVARLVLQVHKVQQVQQVPRVQKVQQVSRDQKVQQVSRALKVQQVSPDLLVQLAPRDLKVRKVPRDLKDLEAQLDLRARLVSQIHLTTESARTPLSDSSQAKSKEQCWIKMRGMLRTSTIDEASPNVVWTRLLEKWRSLHSTIVRMAIWKQQVRLCLSANIRLFVRTISQSHPVADKKIDALIGTAYGGDGTNTFALPDMRPFTPNPGSCRMR